MLVLWVVWWLATPVAAQTGFQSTRPLPRLEYWQQRVIAIDRELAVRADTEAARLVFLGDSITDFWSLGDSPWFQGVRYGRGVWDQSFGPGAGANRAINLAVSGDRIEHMLHRIRPRAQGGLGQIDADGLNPEFVVLLVGINNGWMPEEPVVDSIVLGIQAALDAVRDRLPRARIVLQTLLPTGDDERNARIVEPVNRRILALAADRRHAPHLSLLDLHAAFVDRAGRQVTAYFVDGLHPNEAGYRAWRDHLVRHLTQERGRHAR